MALFPILSNVFYHCVFFNYKYKIELVHIKSSSKSEQINVLSCPNTLNTDTSLNCDSEIPIKIRSG